MSDRLPEFRRRAAAANELVRLRARFATQTVTTAYTRVNGHNAACHVVAFADTQPREVLMARPDQGFVRWVTLFEVVVERTA